MPADFLEGGEPPKAAKGLALALALAPLDEDDEEVDSVTRVRSTWSPTPHTPHRVMCGGDRPSGGRREVMRVMGRGWRRAGVTRPKGHTHPHCTDMQWRGIDWLMMRGLSLRTCDELALLLFGSSCTR